MAKNETAETAKAVADDIRKILGNLDERKVLDILALKPTVLDIEEASMCLSGDDDVFGRGEPVKEVAGAVVSIVTAGEEEEEAKPS